MNLNLLFAAQLCASAAIISKPSWALNQRVLTKLDDRRNSLQHRFRLVREASIGEDDHSAERTPSNEQGTEQQTNNDEPNNAENVEGDNRSQAADEEPNEEAEEDSEEQLTTKHHHHHHDKTSKKPKTATTKRPTTRKPKLSLTKANERFKRCCNTYNRMPKTCVDFCKYDISQTDLNWAFFNHNDAFLPAICGFRNLNRYLYCAADQNDNTACCKRSASFTGSKAQCSAFCSDQPPDSLTNDNSVCITEDMIQATLQCHLAGLQ